ncbi:MAG: hypothetical protein IJX78_06325 [Bacilli bacterium]|nr:hypothetical protein [Bacilli bacterium]
MKIKKGTILLVLIVLIIGIIIGSQNSIGSSNYFEESKNEFEQNITNPDNEYTAKNNQVEGNVLSKVAVKIDEKLNDLLTSLLEKIA